MRILIVGDSPDVVVTVAKILRANNYTVDCASSVVEACDIMWVEEYDLLLLERKLPDGDGVELCHTLRSRGKSVPIMIIGMMYEPEQCITGLDSGADDYLSKPFHVGEFLARVRTLLRRYPDNSSPEIAVGNLILNPARREVCRGELGIALLPKEFAILEYLMRNTGIVRTQEQIGENIWGDTYEPGSNLIESYISRLRKKIEQEGASRLIHTIKGAGYKIMATK